MWETILKMLWPSLIAIGAGIGTTIVAHFVKENKNKESYSIDKEQLKTEIKLEICNECQFRDIAEKTRIVTRQMDSAKSCLNRLYQDMKEDFLKIASEYADKSKILKYNPFVNFREAAIRAKGRLLEVLEGEFMRNHISELSSSEIDDRVDNLYIHMVETYDLYYDPDKAPCRIEYFDKTKEFGPRYKKFLTEIYTKAKEISATEVLND